MKFEDVRDLDIQYMLTTWKNKKTGNIYILINVAFDATNEREGTPVAVYKSASNDPGIFVRDLNEFKIKFTEVE